MFFKTLDIKQRKTLISDIWKTNKAFSIIAQIPALGEFPDLRTKKGRV